MRGDTDTDAAIAGALLSAVYDWDAMPPLLWFERPLECQPELTQNDHRRTQCGSFQPASHCTGHLDYTVRHSGSLLDENVQSGK